MHAVVHHDSEYTMKWVQERMANKGRFPFVRARLVIPFSTTGSGTSPSQPSSSFKIGAHHFSFYFQTIKLAKLVRSDKWKAHKEKVAL